MDRRDLARQSASMIEQPVHDAATIIVLRDSPDGPCVLMGKRGASAAFMPNKFVFPGGRVDASDKMDIGQLSRDETSALQAHAPKGIAGSLVAAGIRELHEETGLHLTRPQEMRFMFRAITPPGRPRRFDARFFLAPVSAIANDPDDFSDACDELSGLAWIALDKARQFDLPFITEVVLAEVAAIAKNAHETRPIPFFRHINGTSEVIAL